MYMHLTKYAIYGLYNCYRYFKSEVCSTMCAFFKDFAQIICVSIKQKPALNLCHYNHQDAL